MNLSLGLRPVWGLVTAQNGPDSARMPSLRRRACSYSKAGPRFLYSGRWGAKPARSAAETRGDVAVGAVVMKVPFSEPAAPGGGVPARRLLQVPPGSRFRSLRPRV